MAMTIMMLLTMMTIMMMMMMMLTHGGFFVVYAQVTRMLGSGRLEVYCFDGQTRLAIIRGNLRKKVRTLLLGEKGEGSRRKRPR